MIRNLTRVNKGDIFYDPKTGFILPKVPTRTEVSGVAQRMYDAGIPTAQQTNNGRGLMSGKQYLDPARSKATLKHYPTKKLINKNGQHH
jgi:hypothetical protein